MVDVTLSLNDDKEAQAFYDVMTEMKRAMRIHPEPMHSAHEGHSVIEEEFDELWDEIKIRHRDVEAMRAECVQLAAMAIRFLVEVCK